MYLFGSFIILNESNLAALIPWGKPVLNSQERELKPKRSFGTPGTGTQNSRLSARVAFF